MALAIVVLSVSGGPHGCVGLRSEEGSWGQGDALDLRCRQGFWDANARTRVRECGCWGVSCLRS